LTPRAIAVKVNTTVENVWKEKSLLKSRGGLVLSRRTTKQSNKKSELILFDPDGEQEDGSGITSEKIRSRKNTNLSDYLIDIPQLDSEGLRTLYREFKSGKKPIDILAEYGFHPDTVEIEYRRFMQLSERDSDELLRRIMLNMIQRGYENEPVRNRNIKALIDLYRQRGYLSHNEILDILALYTQEEVQEEIGLLAIDSERRLPEGFRRLRCGKCNEKLLDAILCDKLPLGKKMLDEYDRKILCKVCSQNTNYDDSS
jgi:hypothetical protein